MSNVLNVKEKDGKLQTIRCRLQHFFAKITTMPHILLQIVSQFYVSVISTIHDIIQTQTFILPFMKVFCCLIINMVLVMWYKTTALTGPRQDYCDRHMRLVHGPCRPSNQQVTCAQSTITALRHMGLSRKELTPLNVTITLEEDINCFHIFQNCLDSITVFNGTVNDIRVRSNSSPFPPRRLLHQRDQPGRPPNGSQRTVQTDNQRTMSCLL